MTTDWTGGDVDVVPPPKGPDGMWLDRLGPRVLRRATPRLGPVLGGAGATLAFAGMLLLAFDTSDIDAADGETDKILGALLCAVGTGIGYALVTMFRAGGLATFGSAVATVLFPFVFFFLTYDVDKVPPFSVDVVLLLSIGGWSAAYLWGPARGRPVLLGAAAIGLWLFILEQVEGAFTTPFRLIPAISPMGDVLGGKGGTAPDPGTIGFVSLIFAAGYLAAAFLLDRRGYRGMAPALFVAGFITLYVGFAAVQDDLEPGGAGLLLASAGVAIVYVATKLDRRGAAWLGGAAVAIGLTWVIGDAFEDTDDVLGPALTLMAVGTAVALGGDRWAAAVNEPSELALPRQPVPPEVAEPDVQ